MIQLNKSVTEEDARANADGQHSAHLQAEEYQGKLPLARPLKSKKLIWRYFTSENWPYAKCNSCGKRYNRKGISNLEKHLIYMHPKILEEIQEEIEHTQLSRYFAFDVEPSKVRCTIDNCKLSIFRGIHCLVKYLSSHHNMKITYKSARVSQDVRKASQNKQRSDTDMSQRSATEGNNASANAGGQRIDASLQRTIEDEKQKSDSQHPDAGSPTREYQQELICTWNSNNLVWRYFAPQVWPVAKCNLCKRCYNGRDITHLEDHLTWKHPQKVREIQEEIRCNNLSSYFILDVGQHRARCIVNNCSIFINIFYGINTLINHLTCHHNINANDSQIKQSDANAMTQEIEIDEDDISTNANQGTASLQAAEDQEGKRRDSTGTAKTTNLRVLYEILEV